MGQELRMAFAHHTASAETSIFSRVVVGVDGSEPGFEACRQAARLVEDDGRLELLAAVQLAETVWAGFSAARFADEFVREAQAALSAAEALAGPSAAARLVYGPPASCLLAELDRTKATLVALGTHGHSRASEILVGGVVGTLLHEARCSVLVARPPADPGSFPGTIVVGFDGSPEAETALEAAEQLVQRLGAELSIVTALRGKGIDRARVRYRAPFAEQVEEKPADALVRAAETADLLVVGSRGLHGLRALGSVSERVAHRAPSSVLVVHRAG
jgi:nucleotide-binding universal stress UspA family protein